MKSGQIKQMIQDSKEHFSNMSDQIWDCPELRFQEFRSSEIQQDELKKRGFTITARLGGMDTAFVASAGTGYPIVGILGEFDALPGLSQVSGADKQEAVVSGGPGHGCGHNLLGTAGVQAAVVLKEYLEKEHLRGTIRYYGCPGEESGAGKTFMVREGCFDDVDTCLSWHPGDINSYAAGTKANVHVVYKFHGKSSHAATAPWAGRSALDAAELMNVGVNYLREHVPSGVMMHYAFLDTGGNAPNIVQADAEMIYVVRAPGLIETKEVLERVNKVAEGAAMMTETEVEICPVSSYANVLENQTLGQLVKIHMKEITETVEPASISTISTDVGDVSWCVPTICIFVQTAEKETTLHTWQMTAQGKSELAHAGMAKAAEIMALTAADLYENPALVEAAKADLKKMLDGQEYICLIPDDVKPGTF